jgi:mono/diheme cytochrome c family protein
LSQRVPVFIGWALAPILLVCVGPAPAADPASAPATAAFEADVKPVLLRNCYPCHNAALKNADLNLTAYETEADVLKDDHTWSKVIQKVRTRVMPPAPFPPLSDEDVALVSGWIDAAFTRAEAAAPPDPGRVTARRLNRTEYDNSVRDLLGVDLRLAADFPQDDTGYGFDNNGDVLSLSPALFEKYMVAAGRIARAAIYGPDVKAAGLVRVPSSRARIEQSPQVLQDYDRSGLTLRNAVHGRHRFPVTATYVVRLILGGERPAASEPLEVGLFVDDQPQGVERMDTEGLGSFSADRQDFSGNTREFRVRVTAGEHRLSGTIVNLYEGLPPSYGGPNPSKRPAPAVREFKVRPELSAEENEKRREFFEKRQKEKAPANDARVTRMEVLGPYDPVLGPSPESVKVLSGCGSLAKAHGASCAAKILKPLVRRAYRRPVTPADMEPLVALVTAAEKRGEPFKDGLRLALQALLVSPDFLFRIERGRPAEVRVAANGPAPAVPARVLTDHELGARLASFLWASLPDVQLLDVADRGELAKPAVLEAQVRRMLADPKAEALVEAFGGQWLQFRGLDSSNPDRERFPDFDSGLAMAMRKETELFLASVMREDKSVIDLLDAPYTYLNERLAAHYGVPGVKGPEFRRVDTTGTPRAGVLTQGSVLTVSSYATRTSPVLRGKWILENVLNAPPPDPPPGTPRIPEDKVGAEAPLRQQLEAHRANATCAACHKRMDPLGFSLENFDAIGRFREQDGKWPVDASGVLPDGRTFLGAPGLRALLRQDEDAFAACVTEKMLTYALGRGLERYDKRTVRAIVASLRQSDYRFSALVMQIVKSLPFQERREEKAS